MTQRDNPNDSRIISLTNQRVVEFAKANQEVYAVYKGKKDLEGNPLTSYFLVGEERFDFGFISRIGNLESELKGTKIFSGKIYPYTAKPDELDRHEVLGECLWRRTK